MASLFPARLHDGRTHIIKHQQVFSARIEVRHLRYFIAAAEEENVSRAGLKRHVSQPALSRQIRDPERSA